VRFGFKGKSAHMHGTPAPNNNARVTLLYGCTSRPRPSEIAVAFLFSCAPSNYHNAVRSRDDVARMQIAGRSEPVGGGG